MFSHRRKGLAFIDLNAPHTITKKVSRNSKWECGAVEWNPHLTHAHIFAYAVSVLFFVYSNFDHYYRCIYTLYYYHYYWYYYYYN